VRLSSTTAIPNKGFSGLLSSAPASGFVSVDNDAFRNPLPGKPRPLALILKNSKMNQSKLSRRKIMQLMSFTVLGSLAIPEKSFSTSGYTDYFDEEIDTIHIKNGVGKIGKIGGLDFIPKFSKHQTSGHLTCDEAKLKPGHLGAPPHLHKTFDEICFVFEGSVSIMVEENVFEVNAGDWHFRPRNKMHTFWNPAESTAKFVNIYIPGGHEDYLADLARLFENNGRPEKSDFAMLEQKHDIVYFWNKLPEIMEKYKVHL
jgi:mannose-6-phosphate isomerase-like protein (cupin superfamily)